MQEGGGGRKGNIGCCGANVKNDAVIRQVQSETPGGRGPGLVGVRGAWGEGFRPISRYRGTKWCGRSSTFLSGLAILKRATSTRAIGRYLHCHIFRRCLDLGSHRDRLSLNHDACPKRHTMPVLQD